MTTFTPKWITKEYFEELFRAHFKNKTIVVSDVKSELAIPTGENYCSEVLRITVTHSGTKNGHQEVTSVIAKYVPNEQIQGLADALNLFDTEIEMLGKTAPNLDEILGKPGSFSPICFDTFQKPKQTLVLEDLKPKGYVVANRHDGLDLDHCVVILKKLALLHAASAVLYSKNKAEISEIYDLGIFRDTEIMKNIIDHGFASATSAMEGWPEVAKYHSRMAELGDSVMARTVASWKKKDGDFCVLNHGDCWTNNFMFTYDASGNVTDCKLVDFQMSVYTSPVVDLHYFLTSSPSMKVASNHVEFLIDFYYANLLVNLIQMKFEPSRIPSREEFRADFKERSFYGLTALAIVVPLMKAPKREDANFESLVTTDNESSFRHDIYKNELFRESFGVWLPYYVALGIFDSSV